MEIVEYSHQEQPVCNSIPRGRPIFVPDLISPITSVAEFESSFFEELQSLKGELCEDSYQPFDDELSVDELKIFTEEELVEKALKEAFKDCDGIENSPCCSEKHLLGVRKDNNGLANDDNACLDSLEEDKNVPTSCKSSDVSLIVKGYSDKNPKKRKKRGRIFDRDNRAAELEGIYIAKVERLAKLKQQQDEDKSAVKLHSFNCRKNEDTVSSSEKVEKMASLRSTAPATKVKAPILHEHIAISYPEVVLCVEIYHNMKNWVKSQESLVLGLQTLTELRDNIYCLTDQVMQKAGQHDPSGYFLIEDTFYNDLRDPSAIDYSEPIFNWLRNSKNEVLEKWECIINGELQQKQKSFLGDATISHLPHLKAVDMHKARFRDLRFRLGAGYLYCHQGNCKHTIVIRDMRLLHPEDVQNRLAYPVLIFQQKTRFRKCSVCKIYRATKVTVDDKWAQENPCYFCDNCYYLLHYGEGGSLLYHEFTVYDCHHE